MNRVVIRDNTGRFIKKAGSAYGSMLERMGRDIINLAKIKVPFKSGDLQNSVFIKKLEELKYRVVFNKEYAAYQERGVRRDGSHKVRKYTTPNTGKNYLKDAGESVNKNVPNYLKQTSQLIKVT